MLAFVIYVSFLKFIYEHNMLKVTHSRVQVRPYPLSELASWPLVAKELHDFKIKPQMKKEIEDKKKNKGQASVFC